MQRRVRRDDRRKAPRAVAEVRRDDELALAAHLHAEHALLPALDHSALTERELERPSAIERAVELRTVRQGARVVHRYRLPGLSGWPVADELIFDLQHAARSTRSSRAIRAICRPDRAFARARARARSRRRSGENPGEIPQPRPRRASASVSDRGWRARSLVTPPGEEPRAGCVPCRPSAGPRAQTRRRR